MTRIPHVAGSAIRRLAALRDGPGFNVAALAGAAVGVWLLASGLDRMREPVERMANNRATDLAGSPLSYRDPVPGLAALAGTDGWRFVVRVDSVPPREERRLCETIAAFQPTGAVTWLDLSGSAPPCTAPHVARPADPREAAGLRDGLRGARWALLDEHDRAVYSARSVPSAAELTGLVDLFRVSPGGGR